MIGSVAKATLMVVISLTLTLEALQRTEWSEVRVIQPCQVKNDTITCVGTNTSIIPEALKFQSERPNLRKLVIICDSLDTSSCATLKFSDKNRSLRSLKVTGCRIGLASSTFEGLSQLESLDISKGMLGKDDLNAFHQNVFPKLKSLTLSRNVIMNYALRRDSFSGLPSHVELDLSNNLIAEFTTVLNQTLNKLDLGYNKLTTVRLSKGKPIAVCNIDFGYNHITHINASDLQNIICSGNLTLDFSGNAFLTITGKDIFSKFATIGTLSFKNVAFNRVEGRTVTSLCNLFAALENKIIITLELVDDSLTDNDIAGENSCFQSLAKAKLMCLNISWNLIELRGTANLTEFFRWISEIQSLEKLDLSANNIISGVVISVTLTNLKFLDLSKNYIPRTSKALSFVNNSKTTVPKLETLRLCRAFDKMSPFTNTPTIDWFNGLNGLKTLDLSDNNLFKTMTLTQFEHFYDGVPHLIFLNLARTDLGHSNHSWAKNVSYPSDTLIHIDISSSYFTDLHMPLLGRLRSLKTLTLTSNSIGRLLPDWFTQLGNITTLDVSDNKIAFIDLETFHKLPKLQNLKLGNNAFGCDCSTRRLAKWLQNQADYMDKNNTSSVISGTQARDIIIDLKDIICLYPDYGPLLVNYNTSSRFACDTGMSVGVAVGALAAVVALCGIVFCCANGTQIRYWTARRHMATYTKYLPKTVQREGSKYHTIESDVFVCYDVGAPNHWVEKYLDSMLQFSRLKYLLLPRGYFCTQIQEIAPTCRSILLVVDEGFIQKVWDEIRPIVTELPRSRMKQCVLVLLDGVSLSDLDDSLQSLARRGTCYEWPQEGGSCCGGGLKSKRDLFWKEVRMTLKGFPKHTITLLLRVLELRCCGGRK